MITGLKLGLAAFWMGAIPALAGTGVVMGTVQKVEATAATTATACSQNHFFVRLGGSTYYGDYTESGKAILSLAVAALGGGKSIDLTWNDTANLCPQGHKKIDALSFQL